VHVVILIKHPGTISSISNNTLISLGQTGSYILLERYNGIRGKGLQFAIIAGGKRRGTRPAGDLGLNWR
jgi:hypothetical protein